MVLFLLGPMGQHKSTTGSWYPLGKDEGSSTEKAQFGRDSFIWVVLRILICTFKSKLRHRKRFLDASSLTQLSPSAWSHFPSTLLVLWAGHSSFPRFPQGCYSGRRLVGNRHCSVCKEYENAEQKCWEARPSSGNAKEEKENRRGGKALRRKSICNLKLIKAVTRCNALILTQVLPARWDRPNTARAGEKALQCSIPGVKQLWECRCTQGPSWVLGLWGHQGTFCACAPLRM